MWGYVQQAIHTAPGIEPIPRTTNERRLTASETTNWWYGIGVFEAPPGKWVENTLIAFFFQQYEIPEVTERYHEESKLHNVMKKKQCVSLAKPK
jgi:hypothetical protein